MKTTKPTLVIYAAVPKYPEGYSIFEHLDQPECIDCEEPMSLVKEWVEDREDGLELEEWICPECSRRGIFMPSVYGEKEIVISEEDYFERAHQDSVKSLLIRRYGTATPASISDWWL